MRAEKYDPEAPLYAREPMKFSGVHVAPGGMIPDRPDRQRRLLFRNGKATHRAPAVKMTLTPGEHVGTDTPRQRRSKR